MGIPVLRLQSDRAKELLSRQVKKWCATMGILQTFTAGDDPASNGHIGSEVNQLKRKTRVKLAETGCGSDQWPMATRHGAEERKREQMEVLGDNAVVYVKMKKWHKEGGLAPSFAKGRILRSCPLMSDGWVVELTDGKILHVREAVKPNLKMVGDLWRHWRLKRNQTRGNLHAGWWANNLPSRNHKFRDHVHAGSAPTTGGSSSSTSRRATAGSVVDPSLEPNQKESEKDNLWQDDPFSFPRVSTAASATGARAMRIVGPGEVEREGARSGKINMK